MIRGLLHKLYVTRQGNADPCRAQKRPAFLAPTTFCARLLLGRRTAKPATIAHGGRHRLYDCAGLRMRPSVVRGTASDPPAPFTRHHQRANVVHDTGAHRARRPGDKGSAFSQLRRKICTKNRRISMHAHRFSRIAFQ